MSQLDAERNIASVIPALDYSDFKKVFIPHRKAIRFTKLFISGRYGH